MSKGDYEVKKMVKELLSEDENLEQRIRKKLEQSRKRREKIPEPVVTRLVDREDPWFTPSYHEQMQELAKKDYQRRHGYKPDDVIF